MKFRDGGALFWTGNRAERAVRDLLEYWMERINLRKRRRTLRSVWTGFLNLVKDMPVIKALVFCDVLRERKEGGRIDCGT